MGFLDMNWAFLKYNRIIAFLASVVLLSYGIYFTQLGYKEAWLFFLWTGLCLLSIVLTYKSPHWVFLGLSIASIALYIIIKNLIPPIDNTPHYQVMIAIIFLFMGSTIDGIYWVYKYEKGTKIKNSYED